MDAAYRKGSELLWPYLVLADRKASDAKTDVGRKEVAEGIRLLTVVVKANPQHWPAFWQIGKAHQALADHTSAHVAFKHAYDINPGRPDVAREYMIECICVGETAEAVHVAEVAVAAAPHDAGLVTNLGLALLADRQLSAARAATERALRIAPEDRITRNLLSEVEAVQRGRQPSNYCPQ
ncbi:hypothetical protein OOT46_03000 [Aquabacterium sp. A7-Y]|uniref:tetratricopeptide repeat protein n=1 Tax=Aquabacterium sp. A7-Y TaxID=1349605 RepID=UPI00223DC88D|nr:hypothetical protein [Aquabacterium sp. A7-Y]MCW7536822.1 hypothetical protein [Aquabacterium sp. A7-Y]